MTWWLFAPTFFDDGRDAGTWRFMRDRVDIRRHLVWLVLLVLLGLAVMLGVVGLAWLRYA